MEMFNEEGAEGKSNLKTTIFCLNLWVHYILYMLAIPLNVLVNDYWEKSAKKRIPKFVEDVISLYEAVQEGVVTDEQLADLLYEYAGVKIEADWLKGEIKDE